MKRTILRCAADLLIAAAAAPNRPGGGAIPRGHRGAGLLSNLCHTQ
ncbi:MAG: hypothetical protein ACLRNQ_21570 [Flavonifractor plautii]